MSQIGWSLYFSSLHQENGTVHWFTTHWSLAEITCQNSTCPWILSFVYFIVVIADKFSLAALEKSEGSWEAHRIARDLELLFVTHGCIRGCAVNMVKVDTRDVQILCITFCYNLITVWDQCFEKLLNHFNACCAILLAIFFENVML